MSRPTTRVLALLELLQERGTACGAELAATLEVDRRTIRRYITVLEDLGIPITTDRGPHGGYQLVAGYKIPPMMFTNDEAVVLALGLAAARGLGLGESVRAVASARAKLERVMPAELKQRMHGLGEAVAIAQSRQARTANAEALAMLGSAAHEQRGVRLSYRAAVGTRTERELDVYGLAFSGGRWYAVGFCHLRRGLRTFRLDRVAEVQLQARRFTRLAGFDTLGHLMTSIAMLPRKFQIEVRLHTDLESARQALFPAMGLLEPDGGSTLLRSEADDLHWFARELARLPWAFEIRSPAALATALSRHARRLSDLGARRPPFG